MKFIFDKIMSFFGLIFCLPLFFVVFILIKIKMPEGNPFFLQKRVGLNGKLFTLFKFRTMKLSHSNSSISIAGENRITPLGAILRKYKIDELPALLNVLKGDMSFVGPRPDVEGYADKLEGEDKNVLKLRPGITGPASLKYSNEEEILASVKNPVEYNNTVIYPDKVKINLDYYNNNSFFGDLKLIKNTIFRTNY